MMRWIPKFAAAFALASGMFVSSAAAQAPVVEGYQARTFKNAAGATMPYRLFVPKGYDVKNKYPLVLWLHGAVGRGTDNLKQISGGNAYAASFFSKEENQSRFPSFVLAPQCPDNKLWRKESSIDPSDELRIAIEILDALQKEFSLDPDRIYVSGQSMGGAGTWSLLAASPQRFAAAIPLCGPADTSTAAAIAKIPVWIFHGAADQNVPIGASRRMVAALRIAGGQPKFTEYPGVGHNVWEKAFADPNLAAWLFTQKRNSVN